MTRAPLSIATGAMPTPVHVALMLTALRLARKGEGGRTVARITPGLGVATVIGMPVGNVLSETPGWQWSFALIASLSGLALLIVLVAFPDDRSAR
ncbi:MFS transporter [Streptomyces sp. NPDC006435]|uniref:MFS transporter n=1 Tax=Streptomyces sp. NPDC006435 TaxID=3154300 RepID=UPI0033A6AB3B